MEEQESNEDKTKAKMMTKKKKETETGIIYLSRIPTLMNVKKIREIFTEFGEVGRLFLQPDEKESTNKHKKKKMQKNRHFTEGWVEFLNKRVAKQVADRLNNQQIGGRRRAPWYDELWNIKYLSKFKWGHLNERLAYEREVHKQRMRTEVAQAKKESNFYIQNVEKQHLQAKLRKKGKELTNVDDKEWTYKQRSTEEEILQHRKQSGKRKASAGTEHEPEQKMSKNKSFLQSIFSGGLEADSD